MRAFKAWLAGSKPRIQKNLVAEDEDAAALMFCEHLTTLAGWRIEHLQKGGTL